MQPGLLRAGPETNTVGDVACHPVDDQLVFVTQLSGGDAVLRSQDGGATFAPFSTALKMWSLLANSRLLVIPALFRQREREL